MAEYKFTKYVRLILPMDGYVFWVKADLLSPSALFNAGLLNGVQLNQPPVVVTPAAEVCADGSLHYSIEMRQDQDHTYSVTSVVFNATESIVDFEQVGPNVLFIGEFEGIKYAFSNQDSFYAQAGIFHYLGHAVYSDMETQLVSTRSGFDSQHVVVSNSLPAWLSLNNYQPFYGVGNFLQLFPSFLVPQNLVPPYGVVHIPPEGTRALASTAYLGQTYSHHQLASDNVKVTLWGTRNFSAQTFLDCVNQYSADYNKIGITNMPIMRDEKRTQVELEAIAQKKTIEFEVSYHQSTMRDLARQLITEAIVNYDITGLAA